VGRARRRMGGWGRVESVSPHRCRAWGVRGSFWGGAPPRPCGDCPLKRMPSLTRLVVPLALALPTTLLAQARTPTPAATLDSARARLAQIDGTVEVSALDSAVLVRRDRWGVPHIYATTQHDLLFAWGSVDAQDRLWQMEMWR